MTSSTATDVTNTRQASSTAWTAVHGLCIGAVLFGLWFLVPMRTQTFEEFEVELPQLTQMLIEFSNKSIKYWYLAIPLAALMLATDYLVLWMSHGNRIAWVLRLYPLVIAFVLTIVSVALLLMAEWSFVTSISD